MPDGSYCTFCDKNNHINLKKGPIPSLRLSSLLVKPYFMVSLRTKLVFEEMYVISSYLVPLFAFSFPFTSLMLNKTSANTVWPNDPNILHLDSG